MIVFILQSELQERTCWYLYRLLSSNGRGRCGHRHYVTARQTVINKALPDAWDEYFWEKRSLFWNRLFIRLILTKVNSFFKIISRKHTGIDWSPENMAESDWDTVTVLRKKGPTAAQAKSKQVSVNIFYCFPPYQHSPPFIWILGLLCLYSYY